MPEAMAARQRRHRLVIETRPEQFASADTDPLTLGKEALEALRRVRQALGAQAAGRAYLDEAAELVKQLAHGPQEGSSRRAKPAPVFDLTTPAGRMKKSMHTRRHVKAEKRCTCAPSRP